MTEGNFKKAVKIQYEIKDLLSNLDALKEAKAMPEGYGTSIVVGKLHIDIGNKREVVCEFLIKHYTTILEQRRKDFEAL